MAATLEDTAGNRTAVTPGAAAPDANGTTPAGGMDAAILPETAPPIGLDANVAVCARSLWKIYGSNTAQALAPENIEKDKATLQDELGVVVALRDASFDVTRGETFVVMGLSGSGKSTLVRCLIRLIDPSYGELYVEGHDLINCTDRQLMELRRTKIAMVFQHYGLLPHRRVIDNVSWGLELRGITREERYERARAVLRLVGLGSWEEAFPRELSGGMQQRVGLARALAVDPDILLMDEPFSGLDPLIRNQMQDELVRLQKDLKKTIIFITHDLSEALKLGDRIAIMQDGRIVQIGKPESIVLRPEDPYVAEFTQGVRLESVLTATQVMEEPRATATIWENPEEALAAVNDGEAEVAWVVNEEQEFVGALPTEAALDAQASETPNLDEAWGQIDWEHPVVTPNTTIDELIPMALSTNYPLPVVDEDNKLVGEIDRATLARTVAEYSNLDHDFEANAAANAEAAEAEANAAAESTDAADAPEPTDAEAEPAPAEAEPGRV